jgi:hypothetical protein
MNSHTASASPDGGLIYKDEMECVARASGAGSWPEPGLWDRARNLARQHWRLTASAAAAIFTVSVTIADHLEDPLTLVAGAAVVALCAYQSAR